MYEEIKKQFKDIEDQLVDPKIINDQKKITAVSKKHAELRDVIRYILELEKTKNSIDGNNEIIDTEDDAELKEMAQIELVELLENEKELNKKLKIIYVQSMDEVVKHAFVSCVFKDKKKKSIAKKTKKRKTATKLQ